MTPWHRFACTDDRTTVRLTMEANQGIVLVLRPPGGRPAVTADNMGTITHVEVAGDTVEIRGTVEDGGAKSVRVRHGGQEYGAQARFSPAPAPLHLTGDWLFRLTPTMDNRWGDFREPAGEECIGAEARQFRYREEDESPGEALGWHSRDYDDGSWPVFTYTFGPYWRASGPLPRGQTPPELTALIAGDTDALVAGGVNWETVCYSQEFGQPGTDLFGGSHGVPDSFLCFDVADEHEERVRYLYTHVRAPRAGRWVLHLGADSGQVEQAWLNGEALPPDSSGETAPAAPEVALQEGLNLLLLACVQPPGQPLRAYAVLLEPSTTPVRDRPAARLTWFAEPTELAYDIAPHKERRAGWYRCEAPAGTHTLHLDVDAESVQVWVNGAEAAIRDGQVRLNAPVVDVSQVALRVEQKTGVYAGAAIRQPVRFECADTALPLGDWSQNALENYSGGAVYKKRFSLTHEQLQGEVVLDLGAVNTTAEVAVNGQVVGMQLARPYRFDITDQVREGENALEVTVYNTLANYFSTGPYESEYVFPGQTVSGLLGPVTVSFPARVTLVARPVVDGSLYSSF